MLLLLASLGGCMSMERGKGPAGCPGCYGPSRGPANIPGLQGPYGTPVAMAQPYSAAPPNPYVARQMMGYSVPLDMVQMHGAGMPGSGSGIMQAGASMKPGEGSNIMLAQAQGMPGMPPIPPPPGGMLSPPGMPFAPGMPGPGMPGMPGAGMPGPGMPGMPGAGPTMPTSFPPQGAVAAVGAMPGIPTGLRFPVSRSQVRFVNPIGMKVSWYTKTPDGKESYSPIPIEAPGRYNFLQAAVYRLKLTNIPGNPGLEIYPTLEVVPANTKTEAFLAHSSVPVSFTPEDFKQVVAGNYVIKVIYLPNPLNQDLAFLGPGEIVSTQLAPGEDPIEEARRRGSVLLVIRMGNMDQQAPNTPRIDAPGPGGAVQGMMPSPAMGMMPPQAGMVPPNVMIPYGNLPNPGMGGVPPLPSHGPFIGGPGGMGPGGLPGGMAPGGIQKPNYPMPGMPAMPSMPAQVPRVPNVGTVPQAPSPPFNSDGIPPLPPGYGKAGVSG